MSTDNIMVKQKQHVFLYVFVIGKMHGFFFFLFFFFDWQENIKLSFMG